jgi:hypothetical protein
MLLDPFQTGVQRSSGFVVIRFDHDCRSRNGSLFQFQMDVEKSGAALQTAPAPTSDIMKGFFMKLEQTRFRLAIPLQDAFAFAMGWSDLGYAASNDPIRQVIGLLVVDSLEYSEQWRASARARRCLEEKWPGLFLS